MFNEVNKIVLNKLSDLFSNPILSWRHFCYILLKSPAFAELFNVYSGFIILLVRIVICCFFLFFLMFAQ